ncbi:hypothetical protein [Paenibacillus thermotolerans]|uniref:hypothetical protein n=1 Tax=Paenibacillus thermotolerans TaxID=3027807 RepID=UPI002367CAFB|nr:MULTISPECIES: hypothetical protein [unclassified Paenibacillus]
MRYTVQYIPLNKLKPDFTGTITRPIARLRRTLWDCAHLMAVKRRGKDGTYVIVAGADRYHYLRKHSRVKSAPCIVDEKRKHDALLERFPYLSPRRMTPASWSIIRSFLKKEPRFYALSPLQQMRLLYTAVRYKKTVINRMKAMIDEMK